MIKGMQFTKRAEDIISKAKDKAVAMRINIISPIIVLSAMLDEVSEIRATKQLDGNIIKNLISIVDKFLSQYVRSRNIVTDIGFDYDMTKLLTEAQNLTNGEFISIDLLLLLCLRYLDNVSTEGKKDIKEAIKVSEDVVKMSTYNSPSSDDPDDKMTKFAVEMVLLAKQNKLDPVIGRDNEIRQIFEILGKKTKSNVIMVGKPGVGKTAIISGIAQLIAKMDVNGKNMMAKKKIYNVDIGSMVAGSEYRGAFEQRLKDLIKETESSEDAILFIDEIHIVLGAGSGGKGAMDAANILKPALANGKIKCIGATTFDEYRKYVQKDPAFERRFVKIDIKEPSIEDTTTILRGLRDSLELHHGIKISDRALVYAASVCKKYIPGRRLPDLAIDLIDTACSSTAISLSSEPPEIHALMNIQWSRELERTSLKLDLDRINAKIINESGLFDENQKLKQSLEKRLKEVEKLIEKDSVKIDELYDQFYKDKDYIFKAKEMRKRIENTKHKIELARRQNDTMTVLDLTQNVLPIYENKLKAIEDQGEMIEPQHVAEVISRLSKIPVSKLKVNDSEKLLDMENVIKSKIFGQDEAISVVCDSIISNRLGLNDQNKPIGSFLFVGPTGVGKTELSKQICKELNDTIENMVMIDMSDYSTEISLTKLIGAPAGYVGYDEGGSLTEPVKEMPYNVVLLDEVDLAHQRNLNILYQMLDEGRITDGRGDKVSFRNCVIIMTTNLGAEYVNDPDKLENILVSRFGHPLINRIDNIIPFRKLDYYALKSILLYEIDEFNRKLISKNLKVVVSSYVINTAVVKASESKFGGRILKRFIKDNFIRTISKLALEFNNNDNLKIIHINHINENVDATNAIQNDELIFKIE
ncbi:CLPB [Hepatospora eriocheir]|uniref:CLPB n=1 Tax=Hepatospora eriocheir TaxID=1081669 RepID=A0A1X0QCW9_9MICR|nr:CLPB [Hepatospora eriocheir]